MSEQLHDRVTDLLERADEQSGSLVAGSTADDESTANDIRDLADEANEILDSADPDELLEAVGLDTLPDGSEPDSIPAAISQGDPDEVDDLRRLLHLARLGDRGEGLEDAISGVRARVGDAETDAAAEGTSADAESESTGSADSAADEASTSDVEDETEDLEERLRSAMTSSLTAFSDDVTQLQERLEALGGDAADGSAVDESESGEKPDETAAEDATEEKTEGEATEEDSDDGLFGSGLGGDSDRGTSGGATRHSTMAPPPSKRADMRGTARFSTMPDKMRD